LRLGHVQIKIRQYADGRWGFDDYSLGARHKVRFRTKQKALRRATDVTVFLANGRKDLLKIDAAELAEFRRWKLSAESSRPVKDVIEGFLRLKQTKSSKHLKSLTGDLGLFEQFVGERTLIGTVTAQRIQEFLDSREAGERRKSNLRASIVELFRWARRMSYLGDRTTEAEKVERIERTPGKANILSPDQMRTLVDNVHEEYLPWLVIAAFAGIRSEEIAPDRKSTKSPLRWEDFDWKHRTIIVREETAKTKEEREVPLLANLAEWLTPWRSATGPVCALRPSNYETGRLGKFIGGWKHNTLRDSFCSYRARITKNVPQVSYEMGNSIAMVKRSYHRRQPIRAAREYFNIRPTKSANVLPFPKKVPKSSKKSMPKGRIETSG
jgi:integrase